MGQYVYVAGGYDGVVQLSSMERYCVHTNQWETLASMHIARSALSLAVVNNKLYSLGQCCIYDILGAHSTNQLWKFLVFRFSF